MRPSLLPLHCLLLATFPIACAFQPGSAAQGTLPAMKILKQTPLMVVDSIEDALPFWTEKLGFQQVATVPHEDAIGFAILTRDGQAVMLQSRASIAADLPALTPHLAGGAVVQYVDVESLDATLEALEGMELLVAPRVTFYGAKEAAVLAPGGFPILFAEHEQK